MTLCFLKAAKLNAMISFDQANRTTSYYQGAGTDILIYNNTKIEYKHWAMFNEKSVIRTQNKFCP